MKKNHYFELVLALTLLFSLLQQSFPSKSNGELRAVYVVAHRGASGYAPENTIAAFDKALEMKTDYIEIDVQRSKDGELVVIHDHKVDRTTNGTGHVKDLMYEQLKRLDAGSWKGSQFFGEKIPAFEEVLDRYHGKIGILIELKAPELYPGMEEQVAQELKKRNLDKPQNEEIIIQSFDFDSMKKMNNLLPDIPIAVLTSNKAHTTEQALKDFSVYADYFNPNYKILSEELVNKAYAHGMKVSGWTVRNDETEKFLLDMNINAIITDYPADVEPRKYAFDSF